MPGLTLPDETRHLLTEQEAAEFLGVTQRTVRTLRARGELEFVRVGKSPRFTVEGLEAFVATHTVGGRRRAG
jgi:excisionase family DNA binding protein